MTRPAFETGGPASASSYRRVCALASGGVGEVELAIREEGRFRRLYAIKRLRDVYRDDDEVREMFLDEARIAGLVRHPNVVSVLDVGDDARGPFLVMDFVEGISGLTLIKRASEAGEEIPLQICLRFCMQVAEGLHAAHELRDARGRILELVHRDVSPQNILIGFDGVARVTDFGIAKALGRTTRTATGILKGKFGYMSPEQLRFEEPDRRSDLFSLGVVLFELISGTRLYRNVEGMDGARRILSEPPPDAGEFRDDVPPELVQLLFSMLAKEVEHRPPTALHVARRLEQILAELVTVEGRLEPGEFMHTAFADVRAAQQQHIEGAIASATGLLQLEPTDDEPTIQRAQPRSRGWVAVVAGLLVLVGLVVGTWLALAPPAEVSESSTEVAGPRVAVEDVEPTPPEPGSAAAPEALGDETPVEPPAEAAVGAESSAPPARMRRRRRPRPAMGSDIPMWDWQ